MKFKRLLATLAFSLTLGVGVFAGIKANKVVKEADAADNTFSGATVYLDTSASWKSGSNDERFAIYYTGTAGEGWYSMVEINTNFYGGQIPTGNYNLIIFCRMNKSQATNDWSNKWNQTGDLTSFAATSAVYKISGWGGDTSPGSWQANSGYTSKFADRYVACADNGWTPGDSNYKLTLDMTKAEARLEKTFSITGSETQEELKVTGSTWSDAFGCQYVDTGVNSNYIDLSQGSNNNIGLKVSGTYEIYWKYLVTNSKNIWIQISSVTEAKIFSENFLTAMRASSVCGTDSAGWNTDQKSKVQTVWSAQNTAFHNLTSGGKGEFKNNSDTIIATARGLYLHIFDKYELEFDDYKLSGSNALSPIKESTSTNIVVVMASSSIIALAAFCFLRKKKEI